MATGREAQLSLAVNLRDGFDFDGYWDGGNEAAVAAVRALEPGSCYLWGEAGSGKSHLLQAACGEATRQGLRPVYLSLAQAGLAPENLAGFDGLDLVALDDLDAVAGDEAWEQALFHLYNRLHDAGARQLLAATVSPTALPLRLPDLKSRCGWGLVFRLQRLDETGLRQALRHRAARRGLELPDEVLDYLLRRLPREPALLFALLDRLDHASLAAQRRLTIPFIRTRLSRLLP